MVVFVRTFMSRSRIHGKAHTTRLLGQIFSKTWENLVFCELGATKTSVKLAKCQVTKFLKIPIPELTSVPKYTKSNNQMLKTTMFILRDIVLQIIYKRPTKVPV